MTEIFKCKYQYKDYLNVHKGDDEYLFQMKEDDNYTSIILSQERLKDLIEELQTYLEEEKL